MSSQQHIDRVQQIRPDQKEFCLIESSTKKVICRLPSLSAASALALMPNTSVVRIPESIQQDLNDAAITYIIQPKTATLFDFIPCANTHDNQWVVYRKKSIMKSRYLVVLELNVLNSMYDQSTFCREEMLLTTLDELIRDNNTQELSTYADFFDMDLQSATNDLRMIVDNIKSRTFRCFMIWKKYSRLIVESNEHEDVEKIAKEASQILKGGRWNWQ